jgi:hypothetical protein
MQRQKRKRVTQKRPSKRFKRFTVLGILLLFILALIPWAHNFTPTGTKAGTTFAKSSHGLSYGIAAGGSLTNLDENDLNNYMKETVATGAKWIRFDIDWSQIQPVSAKSYNWGPTDRVVSAAQARGLKVLGLISYSPKWARTKSCVNTPDCPPNDSVQFAYFALTAAKRYTPKGVNDWEIWNEPNSDQFWQSGVNPAQYVTLLKASYSAIKGYDPSSTVVSGGLAAVGDDSQNMSPLTFVKSTYENGAAGYFDAIAIHPYSFPALPDYPAAWNRWQQLAPIHDVMLANGDKNKKIWITEFGSPTNGPGAAYSANQINNFSYPEDYMTEAAQQEELANALSLYSSYSAWTGPFFYYTLRDTSSNTSSPEGFYGLLHINGSKKPAYDIWQQAALTPE